VQLVEKNDKKPHIRVREQIRDVKGVPTVLKTKNKKTREIPIDDDIIAVLEVHFALLADERERLGKQWKEHMLVFPSSVGTSLGHTNLWRHFKATLKLAMLPNIRFHDLRHTAGSLMLRSDATLDDVSKILGHSDIATTARIYIHSYEDTMRAAVAGTATMLPARKVG
jgi:integrase